MIFGCDDRFQSLAFPSLLGAVAISSIICGGRYLLDLVTRSFLDITAIHVTVKVSKVGGSVKVRGEMGGRLCVTDMKVFLRCTGTSTRVDMHPQWITCMKRATNWLS